MLDGSERTVLTKLATLTCIALSLLCLADCSTPSQSTSQTASQRNLAPSASADPVLKTPGDGIVFGSGWFALEQFKGDTFRWATNDAEVTACSDTNDHTLALELEPGPGINGSSVPTAQVTVTGNQGDRATAQIRGRQWVKVTIGSAYPAETFAIHAVTTNHPSPNGDKRILNYRVLTAVLGSSMGQCKREIIFDGSPLRIASNWYPYETSGGQSFRWVRNNAKLTLTSSEAKPFTLELLVAPGPSLGENLALTANDGHGDQVVATAVPPVRMPSYVAFQFPAEPAGTTITLSAASKNLPVASDPRTLNFRVFRALVRP